MGEPHDLGPGASENFFIAGMISCGIPQSTRRPGHTRFQSRHNQKGAMEVQIVVVRPLVRGELEAGCVQIKDSHHIGLQEPKRLAAIKPNRPRSAAGFTSSMQVYARCAKSAVIPVPASLHH